MTQITPAMAEGLIKLLDTIKSNTDKFPDWIDAVCTAQETLPPGTESALASLVAIAAKVK
ncbi:MULTISPECIES: hypothetical protein [Pseudomonas]|uniref:hypothetical protein n=1 Tax=Pseudomonas TaxID=286 RepID=UPI000A885AC2|nr:MULTISPECIES: hypothetical protein [Pseudomonas]